MTNPLTKPTTVLLVPLLLILSQVGGRAMENQFIRKPGQYPLDDKGSLLAITSQPGGSWALKAVWHSGDASSSAAPDDALRAHGWFVFVEKPERIWIFDGVDEVILLSHSGKQTAFPRSHANSWPLARGRSGTLYPNNSAQNTTSSNPANPMSGNERTLAEMSED